MDSRPVVLLGGGGHAKVIADMLTQARIAIAGCICPSGSLQISRLPWLGDDNALSTIDPAKYRVHVAVGSNTVRQKLTMRVRHAGLELASAVSLHAVISPEAYVGSGVAIMPGAVINCGTRIADGAIVNTAASVDHDCQIGEFAHIAPGTHLAGNVSVGTGAFLGTGVSVIPGVRIGGWAVVGAGGVVICDIPEQVTVVGVPARVKG